MREQDCRNASHNFQSSIAQSRRNDGAQGEETSSPRRRTRLIISTEELHSIQYRKSHKVRQRIMQYFVGYLLTFAFYWIDSILHSVASIDNLLEILTMVFYPLGGFFNLIVFVLPAVRIVQEENVNLCLGRALVSAMISYAGPCNGDFHALRRERRRASIATIVSIVSIATESQENMSNIEECVIPDSYIDSN